MTTNILNLNQTIEVDGVTSVVVTPIVDDGTGTGTSVRQFRIFVDPSNTGLPAVFVLQIKSTIPASLDVSTPQLTF